MTEPQTLSIKKTFQPNHPKTWTWCWNVVLIFILTITPFFAVTYVQSFNRLLYGDVTDNLLQDVSASYSSPLPFKSSWQEHHLLKSDQWEYRRSSSNYLNVLETFIALFDWASFFKGAIYLNLFFNQTAFYLVGSHIIEIRSQYIRHFLYYLFCLCLSILLVLAADGFVGIVYEFTEVLTIWLDSSIIHVGPSETNMRVFMIQRAHPFTQGIRNPYFLQETFRYIGEDVHFICEYKVLGEEGAKPISASSWWNKNGIPIVTNDRLYVNVTVIPATEIDKFSDFGFRYFTIKNTLTIHLVEYNDYGQYTCIYHNPMPMLTIVEPIFEQFEHSHKIPTSPMSPNPECSCKPHQSAHTSHIDSSVLNHAEIAECFAEFELKPRRPPQQDYTVNVPVGGILITSFNYITLADVSDVSFDNTFPIHSSTECCSAMTKLYWILFRAGGFVTFPLSRAVWSNVSDTNALNFGKWLCVCKDSPTQQRAKIYRNVFNSTLKVWETIDIDHPISLVLNASNNGTYSLFESMYFCDGSTSPLCRMLDVILENRFYTLYGLDIMILMFILLYCAVLNIVQRWSKKYLSIPFRKVCLVDLPTPFETVSGPPIKHLNRAHLALKKNKKRKVLKCQGYDIYLTYCHDNKFDRAVADVFKTVLLERGLTLFDPHVDILPGHPIANELNAALHRSNRFVVLVSDAYQSDHFRQLEFDSINDTIKSQRTNAKSRLLVVRLGHCKINGLHRVPSIFIPNIERENFQLKEDYICLLKKWEDATRPENNKKFQTKHAWENLKVFGFNWKSMVCFSVLVFFAQYSSLFVSENEYLQASERNDAV